MLIAFKMSEELVQWGIAAHALTTSHFQNVKSIFMPSNLGKHYSSVLQNVGKLTLTPDVRSLNIYRFPLLVGDFSFWNLSSTLKETQGTWRSPPKKIKTL